MAIGAIGAGTPTASGTVAAGRQARRSSAPNSALLDLFKRLTLISHSARGLGNISGPLPSQAAVLIPDHQQVDDHRAMIRWTGCRNRGGPNLKMRGDQHVVDAFYGRHGRVRQPGAGR